MMTAVNIPRSAAYIKNNIIIILNINSLKNNNKQ